MDKVYSHITIDAYSAMASYSTFRSMRSTQAYAGLRALVLNDIASRFAPFEESNNAI